MSPYEELANAIIIQATKDYYEAKRKLKRNQCDVLAMAEVESIERFFRSEWYEYLTGIDGDWLIKTLREEE